MRGFFGIGIEHTKVPFNIGTLFRSAHALGAAYIFTIGRRYTHQATDTSKANRHIPLMHFLTIDCLLDHLPFGSRLVGVEIADDSEDLTTYNHPDRVCYLLGAEDHGLSNRALEACHGLIQIPSDFCLNVSVAGSIVMYDRLAKEKARKEAATQQRRDRH